MAGHCVLYPSSFEFAYVGTDRAAAAAAAVEGTHWAEAPTIRAAIVRAKTEADHVRRGMMAARNGLPRPEFAEAAVRG